MKTLFLSFAFILLSISCEPEMKNKIINVSDYGIIADSKLSITASINKLIEGLGDEPVTIVFPKGRYD